MLKIQIILVICLLSAASLASPALQKQFFFLSSYGTLSNQLFQTRNGIIAYTTDELNVNSKLELVPTYLLIDLDNKNVTPILFDLTTACEQGPSLFDKLHYHVVTYSLVYYCAVNNTVMLLDEDDYTVQKTIPLNITEIFQEVRIITEGYSIAILGLQGLLSETPAPSHLIKVSLQSKEVVSHVVFDHSLAFGEAVTAYASNDKNLYVLTNTLNDTVEATTVYLMTLIGNSYNLSLLANFTYVFDDYSENLVNELYCVDNLVITNNYDSLIIMNQKGSVLQTIENLSIKTATGNSTSYWRSQLNSEYGSSDFYALWSNDTLVKFSALKGGYTSESIGKANSMQLAVKNQGSNALLFTLSLDDVSSGGNFTITDLETSKIIYQSVASLYDMMITNSTYCVVQEEGVGLTFSIFGLETDTILKVIPIAPYQNEYYYDQQNHVISYVKGFRNGTHQVMQIDLLTGDVYGFETFNFPVYMMQGTNNANFDAPQFVLNVENQSYDYLIISQTFGRIEFTPINVNDVDDLLVDYESLQIYYFTANETTNVNIVDVYTYDTQTKNFILQNSMTNDDVSPAFFYPEQKYTVAWEQGTIAVIELPSLQESNYSVSWNYGSVFLLQGAPGIQFVISQSYGTSQTQPATLYVNGTLMPLSGSNNYTVGAGAASPCSYWVENGVLVNMVVVSVYNMCSQDTISI